MVGDLGQCHLHPLRSVKKRGRWGCVTCDARGSTNCDPELIQTLDVTTSLSLVCFYFYHINDHIIIKDSVSSCHLTPTPKMVRSAHTCLCAPLWVTKDKQITFSTCSL